MPGKLRYINLGAVDPYYQAAIIETIQPTTLTVMRPNQRNICMWGLGGRFDDVVRTDMPLRYTRILSDKNDCGPVYFNDDSVYFHLAYPSVGHSLRKEILAVTARALQGNGIDCFRSKHRVGANDIVVEHNGHLKKICGVAENDTNYIWFLSPVLEYEFLNSLFKLDAPKLAHRDQRPAEERIQIQDFSELHVALRELNPNVDMTNITDEIAMGLSTRLGLELSQSMLTGAEEKAIKGIRATLLNEKWVFNGERD